MMMMMMMMMCVGGGRGGGGGRDDDDHNDDDDAVSGDPKVERFDLIDRYRGKNKIPKTTPWNKAIVLRTHLVVAVAQRLLLLLRISSMTMLPLSSSYIPPGHMIYYRIAP